VDRFLDIFGFLSVVLRGLNLALQSLVVGGAVFAALVGGREGQESALPRRRLLRWAAGGLALVQAGYLASDSGVLVGTTGLPLSQVIGANFFLAGAATVLLSLLVAGLAGRRKTEALTLLSSLGIVAASVATSHATARLGDRLPLVLLTAVHQLAVGCWIGGLPHLILALSRPSGPASGRVVSARFSRLAQASVAALFLGGVGLTAAYVDSPTALYATSYGSMVVAKGLLFALLLPLGALNFLLVRRAQAGDAKPLLRVHRFAEAEIGIGFTAILTAASLTSQPPSVDSTTGRPSFEEVALRLAPRAPRLVPPPLDDALSSVRLASGAPSLESFVPGEQRLPPTRGEILLSEFNHNWSGLVVFAAGVLALAARAGWRPGQHWPLSFLFLAVFLFFLADADYWPVGPLEYWSGFTVAEVAQHRLVVPLVVAFALSEWKVQRGRATSSAAKLVFPLACALGGTLLLTHTHSLNNVKDELLAELSHIPIALLGVTAGWARWLELRLPDERGKGLLAWIWPACLALVGAVLLAYRES
jgi:copper resistance protein D